MDSNKNYFWQGKSIRLRPMHVDDAGLWLVDEQSDSAGVRFLNSGITLPRSEHDARAFVKEFAEFNKREERIMFSIETLEGQLVGGINIHSMNHKNGTFETGSRIYRAYRGKGYFFEAKIIILRYAFHELRFQKYNLHYDGNKRGDDSACQAFGVSGRGAGTARYLYERPLL